MKKTARTLWMPIVKMPMARRNVRRDVRVFILEAFAWLNATFQNVSDVCFLTRLIMQRVLHASRTVEG
jgi:hypothetical protein